MNRTCWDVPRTEEGLQKVLRLLDEFRTANNEIEVGNGLLALAHLVVWVRSDTDKHPFERRQELILQALAVFRRTEDVHGLVRSLVAASSNSDSVTREAFLLEAETLAESSGDEDDVARVLAARARTLAYSDREGATKLQEQALEIYRRTGNQEGQASCLFSMVFSSGADSKIQQQFAIEAASIYRALEDPKFASQCMKIALMKAEKIGPLRDFSQLARDGLLDALNAGDRAAEGFFYDKLARIAEANGHLDESQMYRKWATDLEDADGLTPLQRWENNVEMVHLMISMMSEQGNDEAAESFRIELKRLEDSKPKV